MANACLHTPQHAWEDCMALSRRTPVIRPARVTRSMLRSMLTCAGVARRRASCSTPVYPMRCSLCSKSSVRA
eukprot:30953-Chlamydomonas_euryale.AAC.3